MTRIAVRHAKATNPHIKATVKVPLIARAGSAEPTRAASITNVTKATANVNVSSRTVWKNAISAINIAKLVAPSSPAAGLGPMRHATDMQTVAAMAHASDCVLLGHRRRDHSTTIPAPPTVTRTARTRCTVSRGPPVPTITSSGIVASRATTTTTARWVARCKPRAARKDVNQ